MDATGTSRIVLTTASNRPAPQRWNAIWSDLLRLCGFRRPINLGEPWLAAALLVPACIWLVLRWWAAPHSRPWGEEAGLLLFSVILWQPFMEECCFRGVLQGILLEETGRRSVYGPLTAANLVTSAIFALVHLFTHPWLWALGIFWASLLFGYARERTQSLYPAVFLHSYCNAGYFLLLAF